MSPEGDESQKPKTQGKKKAKTTETFLKDCAPEYREKFENWWKWYKSRCDELNSQWGSKASAAKEWALMESSFDADEFRKGCRLWFKQAKSKNNYAPHGYIFLKGKDTHVEPYWVAALDFVKDSELGDGFMSEKIHEINGDGRPVLSQSQVEELRRIDSEGGYVSNEEAMYIIPGFKVDNPIWKIVRLAA